MGKRFSRSLLLGGIATITASSSCALISPLDQPELEKQPLRTHFSLAIPELPVKNKFSSVSGSSRVLIHKIKPNETISGILVHYGVEKGTFKEILSSADWVDRLDSVDPGDLIKLSFSDGNVLEELIYTPSKTETLKFKRTESGYKGIKIEKKPERLITYTHGTINSSLFSDGKKAGLSEKLIVQLAKIFAWDIDFAQNIHPDDQFTLIYEMLYLDGEEYNTGNILAAEFVTQGQVFRAVRYVDSQGWVNYYDEGGNNLKKAFLRAPLKYTRISSRFNLRRKHPVLNRIRAHKGVDYAAPKDTPIVATGDGKITFVGRKQGFGNVIIIQHQQKYSTLYAHLLGFDKEIKRNATVRQGDVIGYVGKSGLASGYHLHYEFRVNGVHRDPLMVALPKAPPIEKTRMAEFINITSPLLAQLDKTKHLLVAHLD